MNWQRDGDMPKKLMNVTKKQTGNRTTHQTIDSQVLKIKKERVRAREGWETAKR